MQLRGDYNSTSAVNSAAKTLVTITAPPAAAASASSLHLGRPTSMSTLTLASGPTSLLLDATLGDGGIKAGSVSAANTPVAPPPAAAAGAKHTSFALTPTIMGASQSQSQSQSGSGHHVSFMPLPLPMMGIKRLRDSNSNSSLSSPAVATAKSMASGSAPSLVEAAESPSERKHTVLEMRQSVQSQITTLEDVDDEQESEDNTDSDSVGVALVQTTPQLEYQAGIGSSSSSTSIK